MLQCSVLAMVKLSETFGLALPWANLLHASGELHVTSKHVREAVDDLIDQELIETGTAGLRFVLRNPNDRV